MNCCLGIGKSSKTWRSALREDQKDVGLGGWLPYIWSAEGWLYVAAVLDLFSRRAVDWTCRIFMPLRLLV
jgi:hypothetical protein